MRGRSNVILDGHTLKANNWLLRGYYFVLPGLCRSGREPSWQSFWYVSVLGSIWL